MHGPINERTSLLTGGTRPRLVNTDVESVSAVKSDTPLPKKQLLLLCLMRFSEPVCYLVIFPFINQMIVDTGIENPGYASGLIEGTFAFAQLCTVYSWGSLSDRIGRRPVMLYGLFGVALFTSLFGLSVNFPMILLFRFMSGAANGNTAVLKSAMAELTDESNRARAFSFLPVSWAIGSVVAPVLGGYLSHPSDRYPDIFGSWDLFIKFPYLLPCLAGAFITSLGWIAGYLFFEETLGSNTPTVSHRRSPSRDAPSIESVIPSERDPLLASTEDIRTYDADDEPRRLSAREIISDPVIRPILITYIFLATLNVSYDALLPLWLFTGIDRGGLGYSTAQIGAVLSTIGTSATFINIFVFPPLQKRVGTVVVYRVSITLLVILAILFPVVTSIAEAESPQFLTRIIHSPGLRTRIGVAAIVVVKALSAMVFACNMILVNASAPTQNSLGAVNGVAQMVASLMRSIGPTIATVLFAVSTGHEGVLWRQIVWVYLLVLSVGAVFVSLSVREGRPDL